MRGVRMHYRTKNGTLPALVTAPRPWQWVSGDEGILWFETLADAQAALKVALDLCSDGQTVRPQIV